MLEVAIAIAIIALLSASIFPTVAEQSRYGRVRHAAKVTRELADAITAFRVNVGMNPGTLRQLTTPITIADVNSCGAAYVSADVAKWLGPYYRFPLTTAGFPLSEDQFGRVQNGLVRAPANSSAPGTSAIQITGVPLDSAEELNALVDGTRATPELNRTTGRVRWTSPADVNIFVTVSYHVAINGC